MAPLSRERMGDEAYLAIRNHWAKEWRLTNLERSKGIDQKAKQGNPDRNRDRRLKLAGRPKPEECEVCGSAGWGPNPIHWDHDHATNAFRGWLCNGCNVALGFAKEDPARLRALADYIEMGGFGPSRMEA